MKTWRIIQEVDLVIERWGTDAVVYNSISGGTHQLNDFSVSVLITMMGKQFTVERLVNETCILYPSENHSQIQSSVTQLVNNFDHIGLIEPLYK